MATVPMWPVLPKSWQKSTHSGGTSCVEVALVTNCQSMTAMRSAGFSIPDVRRIERSDSSAFVVTTRSRVY